MYLAIYRVWGLTPLRAEDAKTKFIMRICEGDAPSPEDKTTRWPKSHMGESSTQIERSRVSAWVGVPARGASRS